MSKKVYYRYNPSTDNYERVYPSLKKRVLAILRQIIFGIIIGGVVCVIAFNIYESPREQLLSIENSELRSHYDILQKRLNIALDVMEDIQNRDDNFYRVMMQMDPISSSRRFAGLDNEQRYKDLQKLSDAKLITSMIQQIDVLERHLYAQSLSFEELKEMAAKQKDKIKHIPSILPIKVSDYTMSSGYGYRRDPVYGFAKFHEGLDFAASTGTDVFATADGVVEVADRRAGYGNVVDINHGYNYLTRYAHLSKINVKNGQHIKRGEKIGEVGSTGKSTGPHLHYEVRFKGEPQNPINYYCLDLTPEQYNAMIEMAENAGHIMD